MGGAHDAQRRRMPWGVHVTDVGQRVECQWCHAHNLTEARSCDRCGAPLDQRDRVSDAGWRQAPRLRDLTEIHFGSSTVQIDGDMVPVAELALDAADSVFFEHHAMLWKDETVPMSVMDTPGGAKRLLGDMPFVLSVARGPGHLALSRTPQASSWFSRSMPRTVLELRGHALLVASGTMSYSYSKVPGLKTALLAGTGLYLDRFEATGEPGVIVVHGFGNVFERTLAEDEMIHVEPGGFLYKDAVGVHRGRVGRSFRQRRGSEQGDPGGQSGQGHGRARFSRAQGGPGDDEGRGCGRRQPRYWAGAVRPCWAMPCRRAGPLPSWR